MSLSLHPSGERGAFSFTCPECRSEVDRPASRKTVALLIAAGVGTVPKDAEILTVPLAFEDWSPDPTAARITLDDVIAFHFLLQDDVAVAEFLSQEA